MERNCWRLSVLLAIPTAIALLQCTCVQGCGWPSSSNTSQKIIPLLQVKKRAPSSASSVEATTKQRIAHSVKNAPFNFIGLPLLGIQPMKKCPHAWLRASDLDRHNASEWMIKIMSKALNYMVASGYVVRGSRSCFAFCIVFAVPFDCSMAIKLRAIKTVMLTAQA